MSTWMQVIKGRSYPEQQEHTVVFIPYHWDALPSPDRYRAAIAAL